MPKKKTSAIRSGPRFTNAGKRLKKLRPKVKLSAKSYDTLAKRQAAIQRAGGSKTSTAKWTKKGVARAGKRGVVSKRMSNGKMSYWRISAAGKKKRISKEAHKKAKK